MVTTAPVLAPGFYVEEGRCWRMVDDGVGHASHCRVPAGWTGGYVNPKDRRWQVWSCQEHLDELADVRTWGLQPQQPEGPLQLLVAPSVHPRRTYRLDSAPTTTGSDC